MRQAAAESARKTNSPKFSVEDISIALGDDAEEFIAVMRVVSDIIENPHDYTGIRAGIEATKLAAYRTKIGMKAQMYKSASVGSQNAHLRPRKDVLMCLYEALLENINTLKGLAKYEREVIN